MPATTSGDLSEQPPIRPTRHDLYLREGAVYRMFLRLRDQGVTVWPDRLEWSADGRDRSLPFSDIVAIRLETGHVPRSGDFGNCIIRSRRAPDLIVNSLNGWGTPDSDRIDAYVAFVRDLHARLGPDDRRRIHFLAGNTRGRYRIAFVATIVAAAMFVVLPVVLFAITGEAKALFLTLAGAFFVYPVVRMISKNAPRSYAPDRLTDDLFP